MTMDDVDNALREALGLAPNQVPEYILRMRDMGPLGYPPALIDTHVRVRDSLPFFGGSIEAVLPKRTILREDLPAFRGYTHKNGNVVSEQFFALMQRVAEIDHEESHKAALERSGIEEFMDGTLNSTTGLNDSTMSVNKTGEVIRYEIPEHEASGSNDYIFGKETGSMKHTLEGFAEGIQPFEHSHVSTPSHFMSKLKGILNSGDKKKSGNDSFL